MSLKVGQTDGHVTVYAVSDTDYVTPKTGMSGITVYYSLNGGSSTAMTTPTVTEIDSTNVPGAYDVLVDEAGMSTADGELTIQVAGTDAYIPPRVVEIKDNTEKDVYDRIGSPVGADISGDIATIDTVVDSVLVDTGTTLPASITALNDISSADVNSACDTALTDYDAPTKAELDSGLLGLNDPTAVAIRTEIDSNSTQLSAIVADTDEIQTDLADGGRLDLLIDAIKAKTDGILESSDTIDGTITYAQAMKLLLARIAGIANGGGTNTIIFKAQDDSTTVLTLTVDPTTGDRSAVVENV